MKNWTAIATFLFLMMVGSAAHSEGISAEDVDCGNDPQCLPESRDIHSIW